MKATLVQSKDRAGIKCVKSNIMLKTEEVKARINQISIHAATVQLSTPPFARSDTFATEFDLEAEEYVPLPKGDVHKRKEVHHISILKSIPTPNLT